MDQIKVSQITQPGSVPQEVIAYNAEYQKFVNNYHRGEVSGEEVGEVIARMAQYFGQYNMEMVTKERGMNLRAAEFEMKTDENGKTISSTKAKVLLEATTECYAFNIVRMHLQNIEQYINALKSLQKGVLNEMQHMGI